MIIMPFFSDEEKLIKTQVPLIRNVFEDNIPMSQHCYDNLIDGLLNQDEEDFDESYYDFDDEELVDINNMLEG